ncbi:hypothetical protein COEREDRAFT_6974 [Coemansia reversa NRRL 1564]|uniref:SLC26A/SulP transporter domain-containing protein n=1 Tax=Coemansia reversa (strain ATCC 12441 / NRRL 1564) TaxID=763665 RepID=A0A2G5BGE7_COERN|nr:hypothetical protein COEREDRAFT_6974 [Coemansia reversa NRRL 1564]|eukprot:PIA17777.1 hypothetical protein COEREDRAFT_6974 [Coemansia reversa NRRL 1564]
MSTFPYRRRTAGVGSASGTQEHNIEVSTTRHSYAQQPATHSFAHHDAGTRSIRIGSPALTSPRVGDAPPANYSQTSDSIRGHTMILSNFALHAGIRDSISSNRSEVVGAALGLGPGGGTRRSSMDDWSSTDQILSGPRPGGGNLSRLLCERPNDRASATGLPRPDYSYLGVERVPKNARTQVPALLPDEGCRDTHHYHYAPTQVQQPLPLVPHAEIPKQHPNDIQLPDEQEPLISRQPYIGDAASGTEHQYSFLHRRMHTVLDLVLVPLQYIPAVILGLIMNLLDALSYGLIAFPVSIPVFAKFGPIGFSMYMLSTAVAQLVYSGGASAFRGANGTMLIEAIPFYTQYATRLLQV